MEDTLKLVGRNSNEIYLLRYPSSLLDFCGFDLAYFAKTAIDACSEAQKTGKADPDVFAQLRRDIQSAHCYIAHNIRTIYEKVVLDCWIDYLCRRDSIGTGTLWNRYIECRTPFDKMVFARLCEFRYNRAINEWLNIVRVQDYAKSKIDFVFTKDVKKAREAASRRNYFDLMFSVTAQEMGCRVENLGEIKVFSVGRTPSSPFMFSTISKDIVRHVLSDFDYTEDYSDIGDYSEISDQIAMDAFSKMKAGLPAELSSYNIVRGKMENYTEKIYMPCSLKAVVDLEIDAIIENGGILCACKRCGRLYLKNENYNEDYCRTYLTNGKTCLELYREENPLPVISPELEEKCRAVTDEIYARVGSSMSEKEYEYWYSYMSAMRDKVTSGEITAEELNSFLEYSLNVDISRSRPIVEVPKHDDRSSRERVVKPFVPERISRSELSPTTEPEKTEPEQELPKEGFFTSPTVFRRKNEGQQISHIIRGGESRGAENSGKAEFQAFSDAEEYAGKKAAEDRARLEELRRKITSETDLPTEELLEVLRGEFVPFAESGSDEKNTRNDVYFGEDFGSSSYRENSRNNADFGSSTVNSRNEQDFGANRRDNSRNEQDFSANRRENSRNNADFGSSTVNSRNEQDFGASRRENSRNNADFGTNYRENSRNNADFGSSTVNSRNEQDFGASRRDNSRNNADFGSSTVNSRNEQDFSANRRENSRNEQDFSANRRDNSRNEQDFSASRRDNSLNEQDFSANRRENSRNEQDFSANRRENSRNEQDFGANRRENSRNNADFGSSTVNSRNEQDFNSVISPVEPAPRPKVIKKNAAAISAYGKISGAPVTTAPPDMDLNAAKIPAEVPPKQAEKPNPLADEYRGGDRDYPDDEPYKDIGSIFDVLERSESNMSGNPRKPVYPQNEPSPEWEKPVNHEEPPLEVTKDNAPSGIWTEDRHLYGSDTQSELDMLKEKKHNKSNKTRRLYDVIMREPDDNPNFRRKN